MHASSFKIYGLLCRPIYTVKMKTVNILHIIQTCLNNENDKSIIKLTCANIYQWVRENLERYLIAAKISCIHSTTYNVILSENEYCYNLHVLMIWYCKYLLLGTRKCVKNYLKLSFLNITIFKYRIFKVKSLMHLFLSQPRRWQIRIHIKTDTWYTA